MMDTHLPQINEPIVQSLVEANTRFAFKLFAEMIAEQGLDENLFISPLSISLALAMTYNGAAGETQRAMAETLEIHDMDLDDVNQAFAALRTHSEAVDPQVIFALANSLWVDNVTEFKPEFIQRNRDFYDAEVRDLGEGLAAINAWVNDKTEGNIPEILNSPGVILVLLNAIYFKGEWARKFDASQTTDGVFTLLDGSQKTHPMMRQSGKYRYYRDEDVEAVALPYGVGKISMYIFLPTLPADAKPAWSLSRLTQKTETKITLSFDAFTRNLTVEKWDQWMAGFHEVDGEIVLPRFKIDFGVELNDALITLGMKTAFAGQANFANMCPGVWIDLVVHKAFVEVNEEGTEAAAVTAVVMRGGKPLRFQLTIDRPFFFAIRDDETGSILFMGTVTEPA